MLFVVRHVGTVFQDGSCLYTVHEVYFILFYIYIYFILHFTFDYHENKYQRMVDCTNVLLDQRFILRRSSSLRVIGTVFELTSTLCKVLPLTKNMSPTHHEFL